MVLKLECGILMWETRNFAKGSGKVGSSGNEWKWDKRDFAPQKQVG